MIGQQQAQARFDQRNEVLQRNTGNNPSAMSQQPVQTGHASLDSEERDVTVVAVLGYN